MLLSRSGVEPCRLQRNPGAREPGQQGVAHGGRGREYAVDLGQLVAIQGQSQGAPGQGAPGNGAPGNGAPGKGGEKGGEKEGGPRKRPDFKTLDKNGDGFISADEVDPKVWEKMKNLDKDGDGKISEQEFKDGMKARGGKGGKGGDKDSQGGKGGDAPKQPGA